MKKFQYEKIANKGKHNTLSQMPQTNILRKLDKH